MSMVIPTDTEIIYRATPLTKRVKSSGARQEIIRLIMEANPGTFYDTLTWDDFNIEPQLNPNDAGLHVQDSSASSYPLIHISVRGDRRHRYAQRTHGTITFNVNNAIHLNDVFTSIFNTTEFTDATVDELKNKLREYIPGINLVELRKENNEKTTVYKLELSPNIQSESINQEFPYTAFIDSSEKVKSLLEIKLHTKDIVDFDPDSGTNKTIENPSSGIYENT